MLNWDQLHELHKHVVLFTNGLTDLIEQNHYRAQVLAMFDEFTNDVDPDKLYPFDVRFLAVTEHELSQNAEGVFEVREKYYPVVSIHIALNTLMMAHASVRSGNLGRVLTALYLSERRHMTPPDERSTTAPVVRVGYVRKTIRTDI